MCYNSITESYEHPIFGSIAKNDVIKIVSEYVDDVDQRLYVRWLAEIKEKINTCDLDTLTPIVRDMKRKVASVAKKYSKPMVPFEPYEAYLCGKTYDSALLLLYSDLVDPFYIAQHLNKINMCETFVKLFIKEGLESVVVKAMCILGFDLANHNCIYQLLQHKPDVSLLGENGQTGSSIIRMLYQHGIRIEDRNAKLIEDQLNIVAPVISDNIVDLYKNWKAIFDTLFFILKFKPENVRSFGKFSCEGQQRYFVTYYNLKLACYVPEDSMCKRMNDEKDGVKVCPGCKNFAVLSDLYFEYLKEVSLFELLRNDDEDKVIDDADELEKLMLEL
mgnify:CR=1 FL=1